MADNELEQNAVNIVAENVDNKSDNSSSCSVSENVSEESENVSEYTSSDEYESLEDFCNCNSCSIFRENQKQVLILDNLSRKVSRIETQFCDYLTLSKLSFILNVAFSVSLLSAISIAWKL